MLRRFWDSFTVWVRKYWELPVRILAALSALAAVAGYVFRHMSSHLFPWLQDNVLALWCLSLTLLGLLLFVWIYTLHRRFVRGFRDDFTNGDLRRRWDYVGNWRIEDQTLLVAGPEVVWSTVQSQQQLTALDCGGLTKVGARWENYTLTFQARLLDKCLGVVVRARDLNNYYMLQIWPDKVRPHLRLEVPLAQPEQPDGIGCAPRGPEAIQRCGEQQTEHEACSAGCGRRPEGLADEPEPHVDLRPMQIYREVRWIVYEPPIPIEPPLAGWFSVRIAVSGETLTLYVNDLLVTRLETFIKIPLGKVGFRNWLGESAQVKAVRVTLDS